MPDHRRWGLVALYAVAMAWAESAVVFYLRRLAGVVDPYEAVAKPIADAILRAELLREAATLLMLVAVGGLAGRTGAGRFGFFLVAFGVWDILYYVFLIPLTGWPRSLADWDILFLIPLPWWGPVWAPVSIAVLMAATGVELGRQEGSNPVRRPGRGAWTLCLAGAMLALYVFMADAIRVAPHGIRALEAMRPTRFNWPPFLLAWLLMAAPVADLWRQKLEGTTARTRPRS